MNNILVLLGFIFGIFVLTSCSKETLVKEEIETGLLCELQYERNYSEWCVNSTLNYHIGYPGITCFDSMLISFPLLNNGIDQYGNYPIKSLYLTYTYFESLELYRIDNYDCTAGDDYINYRMFVEKADLLEPSQVDVLFYFYTENQSFPTDSLVVEFKPWND